MKPVIQDPIGKSILVKDPVLTAREILGKLRNSADLIILLSDLAFSGDRDVVEATSGIHFVLGGHEGLFFERPHQEGETYIIQSYERGIYVSKLLLTLRKHASSFQDEGKADQMRQQIHSLDLFLSSLQRAVERYPSEKRELRIQQLKKQKAELHAELERTVKLSRAGNRFLWTLEPLHTMLPEDEDVRRWIHEAGIDRD